MPSSCSLIAIVAAFVVYVNGSPGLAVVNPRDIACGPTTVTETCTVTVTPTCGPTTVPGPPEPPKPTLDCLKDAYLIQGHTLYTVDLKTGAKETISKTVGGSGPAINSLGHNPKENYLYGTQGKTLIRITSDGKTAKVLDLPITPNIGDFDENGQYWYSSGGTTWGRVDLNPGSATYGKLVETGKSSLGNVRPPSDWAYTPASPGYLYGVGVTSGSVPSLVRWSTKTHKWEVVYNAKGLKAQAFGGVMSTSDGVIYGSDNGSGGIFRFPIDDPHGASRTATGPKSSSNDGTRCMLLPDSST
ncbi:hypothetical protein ACHAQJ_001517 [Trichoderma viride]